MPSSVRPPLSPSTPPDASLVASAVERLREEHDAQDNATQRAVLLHEIAVLEELLGDESGAARDHLAAVNSDPDFREPLERLIAIIERRQSYKNLGKLLERLQAVADTPEERSRASLERSFFLTREGDVDGARQPAEDAVNERADDPAGWLWLEVIGGRLADAELRLRALSTRCALTPHPHWRALLNLDLARARLSAGDTDAALEAIHAAVAQKSPATFEALGELESAARKDDRFELLMGTIEAQASLLSQAAKDEQAGRTHGVPKYLSTPAHAAEHWLRAAQGHRNHGQVDAATRSLERALQAMPDDPTVVRARLEVAQASGDTETAARLSRTELDRGAKGLVAAALWLRVAEHAAATGDGPAALHAVSAALREDPGCVPARSLELDLLAGGPDHAALASAFEATSEQVPTDAAKVRFFLLAADQWARASHDVQNAKAALSQASLYGAGPELLARVARTLAAISGDITWYEEATRRLAGAGALDGEATTLAFEVVRSRLLRKDPSSDAALDALAATDGGAELAHGLRAYALALSQPEWWNAAAASGLHGLAQHAREPAKARALRQVEAVRALLRADIARADDLLTEIHQADPGDLVTVSALASVLEAGGDSVRAATALRTCAAQMQDQTLAAALLLEAGFSLWKANERASAITAFAEATERAADAGATVTRWALRAVDSDGLDARRRSLDAATYEDRRVAALERFALEVGRSGNADAATAALGIREAPDDDLGRAIVLARALWRGPSQPQALDAMAGWGPASAALARAAEHQIALGGDPGSVLHTATRWAEADKAPSAALEWLGAALAQSDVETEVLARRRLAACLEGAPRVALEASATLVQMLYRRQPGPLLEHQEASARLANFELALPGSDPRRRARALGDVGDVFGEAATALASSLAGYNLLSLGDVEGALHTFRGVVEANPEEIAAWEGLRAAAGHIGDRATVAEACAALGDLVADAARGAELWERAALVLIDELGDAQRGELALSRAIERDIRRAVAFDKLFRIVRAKKDNTRLVELIALRLEVAEDPQEIAKLYWERARALREAGDRSGALAALENVTMLEPDHVGALALAGEIYITQGQFSEGAQSLARLAELDSAPAKQRLMSGVAAVDLYENKLGEPSKALGVLVQLHQSGLSTLPVRERLARAAAKADAWQQAIEVFEQLMHERDTRQGRMEAARLALVIHRDRLGRPEQAGRAVVQLLSEQADEPEALELVLSGALAAGEAQPLLERARVELVRGLAEEPLDVERIERLSRVAEALSSASLRQATLGVLFALGMGGPAIDRELSRLDERGSRLPKTAVDEQALPGLVDPEDRGPFPELLRVLGPTLSEAVGPVMATFGVGKKERVDARAGGALRDEIATWAGALGVIEFDLYVGGSNAHAVHVVATERPAIVLGRSVAAPLAPQYRQLLARELLALKRGTTALRYHDLREIAALIVAVCKLGGHELPLPYSLHPDVERRLQKALPRKVKKMLPELGRPIVAERRDPVHWAQSAVATLDRMGAVAVGDISWVLSDGNAAARGRLGASLETQERARRLSSFVLSPLYLELRERLGMDLR